MSKECPRNVQEMSQECLRNVCGMSKKCLKYLKCDITEYFFHNHWQRGVFATLDDKKDFFILLLFVFQYECSNCSKSYRDSKALKENITNIIIIYSWRK